MSEDRRSRSPGEDVFLGAMMGFAIGDALGMPAGNGGQAGEVTGFRPLTLPDGTTIEAGEFTEETEVLLSIVEVATTSRGELDADLIGARMVRLALGDSGHWQDGPTRSALRRADDTFAFSVPIDEDGPVAASVATRGVAVGLLACVGRPDDDRVRRDAELVTRLTHGSPAQIRQVEAVAWLTVLAARGEVPAGRWAAEVSARLGGGAMSRALTRIDGAVATPDLLARLASGSAEEQVAAGTLAAISATSFEAAVLAAAGAGGKADAAAAIAGALAGARWGIGGVPQPLIDGLGGRIYVSLAAPWFRRAAMYRAGLVVDLPTDGPNPPRPSMPPRQ